MPKTDLVFSALKGSNHTLLEAEKYLLEVKLLMHFYDELFELFKVRHQEYQKLIQSNQEEGMFSSKFMQQLINDILATEEYTLAGIAKYTHIPEEVLYDVAAGMNVNPTLDLSRKLFQLHMTLRRELYDQIMRKVISGASALP